MAEKKNFTRIGERGIGNIRSQVARSMSYFKGSLYLGVTHPKGEGPDDAARILRYDIDRGEWETAYQSPLVEADVDAVVQDVYRGDMNSTLGTLEEGVEMVPQYRGFRCMTQFTKKGSDKPLLFASTLSHWGSQLLVSEDGETFDVACEPGLGNPDVLSFRTIISFNNKLFVSPVGTVKEGVMDRMFGDVAKLYVSDDPMGGQWEEAIPPGFGDPSNLSVFCMAVFDDHLYAGTGNPTRGFQLWKTKAEGRAPYQWTQVLTDGGFRFNDNEFVASMSVMNGELYVGSGIPGLGYDKAYDVGPAAAELFRVRADDSWDLLVGAPRFTPDGFKVPLAGMGPGFDDPENSALWSMATHDDTLYVGTHHCGSFHDCLGGKEVIGGGFQLWSSRDGEAWTAQTMDGFDDRFSTGVRTLVSTPNGLFLGTSTHREVEKIWARRTGGQYQPELGGLCIWLGK